MSRPAYTSCFSPNIRGRFWLSNLWTFSFILFFAFVYVFVFFFFFQMLYFALFLIVFYCLLLFYCFQLRGFNPLILIWSLDRIPSTVEQSVDFVLTELKSKTISTSHPIIHQFSTSPFTQKSPQPPRSSDARDMLTNGRDEAKGYMKQGTFVPTSLY